MITKYNNFVNENLLKGKSKDNIEKILSELDIDDRIEKLIETGQDIKEWLSKEEILRYLSLMDINTWFDEVDDLELGDEYLPIISDYSNLVIDKFNGDITDGYNFLIKDTKLNFEMWADVWFNGDELQFEWNQQIFDTRNTKDILAKKIQLNGDVFGHVYNMVEQRLITDGIIE